MQGYFKWKGVEDAVEIEEIQWKQIEKTWYRGDGIGGAICAFE